VIPGAAPQDRISAVPPPTLPPLGLPLLSVPANSSGLSGGGWLYDLLTKAGVDPSTARSVVEFVIRPVEILVVVLVAALVAHYGAKGIRRVFGRVARQAAERSGSARAGARMTTVVALLSNVWRFFIAVVAVFIVLGMLGINLTPLLASATVIGATIGFGAQSLVRDYLSGILLTVEDQYGIGDTISVNDTTGVVEDLSLRVTRMRAGDGSIWYVPNGDIRRLGNTSRGWAKAFVDLPARPGDAGHLTKVIDAVAAAAREVAQRPQFAPSCTEPPEVLGIVETTEDHCIVRVGLRTVPTQRDALERALREAAVARLVAGGLWPEPTG